jgi:multidrug efflux pump subunit AcrA (membrane-fusion protein)
LLLLLEQYLLGDNQLEIEVDISETDITKISKNDEVEITLDALDENIKLYGKVYSIEPAETVIQDVIYYRVKIYFDIEDYLRNQIKPGMTANTTITTEHKEDVLIIPSRAIIEKNGDGNFTRIISAGGLQEVKIITGLYGDDGLVEVVSGLTEGQEVVTYINKKK